MGSEADQSRGAFYGHVNSTPLPFLRGSTSADAALRAAEALDGYIVDACNASMPLRTSGPAGRKPVYWWSDHIADLRSTAFRLRRAYQASVRRLGPERSREERASYSVARRDLRLEIKKAKEKGWSDLCSQVDSDPWGKPYKIVMKKLGNGSTRLASKGREHAIADHLFPAAPVTDWRSRMPSPKVRNIFDAINPDTDELEFTRPVSEFEVSELLKAAKKMSSGKARGPSGIPNEILKKIIIARPRGNLRIYNECLKSLSFLATWKKARSLIPDLPSWTGRKFGELNFHLSQFLSGHECFRKYLHSIRKVETTESVDCRVAMDDADYALFSCGRWGRQKAALEVVINRDFTPQTTSG